MSLRRVRLSVETLEDRTTPATVSDLFNYAYQTHSNAWLLNQLNHDPMRLANPAIRPMVQSLFTTVYQQATTTTQLLNQFPGALPPGVANMVAYEAAWEASSAQWVAHVLGFTVTPAPAPTPAPVTGPASPATSSVSINPTTVAVNGTVAVLLTAKNASGTPLTTGGATVTFGLGSGGTAQGTFSAVTDNHDGTYSATFTATVAGTTTITATIGGQAVTTTAPTLTVTAATTQPSPAKSTISIAAPSVPSGGSTTVTLTAKDANGNPITTGGATVLFGLGTPTGAGTGTFGGVTDHGDGTYTASFTGGTPGVNTITATINTQLVTTTAPSVTIVGAADPAQSTVSVSPASITTTGTATVTLTAKDALGNQEVTGGSIVLFSLGTGAATGTFSNVVDHGDGTYSATFTPSAAGDNTITATIDTQPLTSPAAPITVTNAGPGPVDLAQSVVTVAQSSVAVNGTTTVTLTAKDANGTQLATGGLTVAFGLGTPTGAADGTFTNLVDHGDGTYTATFTGTTAGNNTITATIGGQPVTSTAPGITVTAAPGPIDPGQSTVTISPASVGINGTATVTLTAKDANGTPLTTGGATVAFGLGSGAGQGDFTNLVDHGDGTYTATFTGTTAGDNTITATINTQPVTTTAPPVTVIGPADPAQSTVTINPSTVPNTTTATVTLTAKDANGHALTTGGATVDFAVGAGVGQGTFTNLVDHGDGTYTATFTASVAGDNTIVATLNTQTVTSSPPFTVS